MIPLDIPAIAQKEMPYNAKSESAMQSPQLIIDDSASARLWALMQRENCHEMKLRIRIRGGGCSGFQYDFELTNHANPEDIIWQQDGTTIIVDPLSQQMLNGSRLEYFQTPMESGFRLDNPHAKTSCGCGVSFST